MNEIVNEIFIGGGGRSGAPPVRNMLEKSKLLRVYKLTELDIIPVLIMQKIFLYLSISIFIILIISLFFSIKVNAKELCTEPTTIYMDTMKCIGGITCTKEDASSLIRIEQEARERIELKDIRVDCLVARCVLTNGIYYAKGGDNKLFECNIHGCKEIDKTFLEGEGTCICPENKIFHPCLGCVDEEIYQSIPEIFNQRGKCLAENIWPEYYHTVKEWRELTAIAPKCKNSNLDGFSLNVASGFDEIKKDILIGTFYYEQRKVLPNVMNVRKISSVTIPPLSTEEIKISGLYESDFRINFTKGEKFCIEMHYLNEKSEDVGGGKSWMCELTNSEPCEIDCTSIYPDFSIFDCSKDMPNIYIGFQKAEKTEVEKVEVGKTRAGKIRLLIYIVSPLIILGLIIVYILKKKFFGKIS